MLSCLCVHSQSNFIEAIVILNSGDSLYGNLDYRNWKNNPQTIHFTNSANEKKVFDPTSIKGFYIPSAHETYLSYNVNLDTKPGDRDEAIKNNFIDTVVQKKYVFLLQLMNHYTLRLYQFVDRRREHFYYAKESEEPVELIHNYLLDVSRNQVNENATYKEQLSGLFNSCPDVISAVERLKFKKVEVQNIFQKYLQCNAPGSVVDIKEKDPVFVKWGVIAGLMYNTFEFEGNNLLVDENYSGNLSSVIGVSVDVALSRNQHKWHIVNEVIYKSYKTGNTFTWPYNGYTVTSNVDMAFSYVQLNSLLRYIFLPKSSLQPYINFGVGNAFIVAEPQNKTHLEFSFGSEEDIKAIDEPRKYECSFLAGTGIMIRSIQIELRYGSNKKGFSPSYSMNINPKSFQCLVTYKF